MQSMDNDDARSVTSVRTDDGLGIDTGRATPDFFSDSEDESDAKVKLQSAVDRQPAQPAASSAPMNAWFFGWCRLVDGHWQYWDESVEWPALGAKVIHVPSSLDDQEEDDTSIWQGVIKSHDDTNGWTIEGQTLDGGEWRERSFLDLDGDRLYICCDEFGDPAEPAKTAPKMFQHNEFDTIPDK